MRKPNDFYCSCEHTLLSMFLQAVRSPFNNAKIINQAETFTHSTFNEGQLHCSVIIPPSAEASTFFPRAPTEMTSDWQETSPPKPAVRQKKRSASAACPTSTSSPTSTRWSWPVMWQSQCLFFFLYLHVVVNQMQPELRNIRNRIAKKSSFISMVGFSG